MQEQAFRQTPHCQVCLIDRSFTERHWDREGREGAAVDTDSVNRSIEQGGLRGEFLCLHQYYQSQNLLCLLTIETGGQTTPVSGESGNQAASSVVLPSLVEPGPQAQGSEDPRGPCGAHPLGLPKGSPVEAGWGRGECRTCLLELIPLTRSEIHAPFCPVGSTQAAKSPITKSPRCQFCAFLSCLSFSVVIFSAE